VGDSTGPALARCAAGPRRAAESKGVAGVLEVKLDDDDVRGCRLRNVVDSPAEFRDRVAAEFVWLPSQCDEAVSEALGMSRRSVGKPEEDNDEPVLRPCAIEPLKGYLCLDLARVSWQLLRHLDACKLPLILLF